MLDRPIERPAQNLLATGCRSRQLARLASRHFQERQPVDERLRQTAGVPAELVVVPGIVVDAEPGS